MYLNDHTNKKIDPDQDILSQEQKALKKIHRNEKCIKFFRLFIKVISFVLASIVLIFIMNDEFIVNEGPCYAAMGDFKPLRRENTGNN